MSPIFFGISCLLFTIAFIEGITQAMGKSSITAEGTALMFIAAGTFAIAAAL